MYLEVLNTNKIYKCALYENTSVEYLYTNWLIQVL